MACVDCWDLFSEEVEPWRYIDMSDNSRWMLEFVKWAKQNKIKKSINVWAKQ